MKNSSKIDRVTFRIFSDKGKHVNPDSSFSLTLHARKKQDGSVETMKDITARLNADTDGAIYKVLNVVNAN